MWNNLFSNAIKFNEPNVKVTVRLKIEEGFAVVKVSDTGCGINLEVKRVIDIVDCEISVESEAGKGSTMKDVHEKVPAPSILKRQALHFHESRVKIAKIQERAYDQPFISSES